MYGFLRRWNGARKPYLFTILVNNKFHQALHVFEGAQVPQSKQNVLLPKSTGGNCNSAIENLYPVLIASNNYIWYIESDMHLYILLHIYIRYIYKQHRSSNHLRSNKTYGESQKKPKRRHANDTFHVDLCKATRDFAHTSRSWVMEAFNSWKSDPHLRDKSRLFTSSQRHPSSDSKMLLFHLQHE